MSASQFFKAAIVGILFLGLVVVGPATASAGDMWFQPALFLVHLPLGGGQFYTTNYIFAASEGANTTVNVKCFNDASQRIGPVAGVNVELSATGQVARHTPTTLGVTSDPLFTGNGWCWANNINSGLDFTTEITLGLTTDLTVGAILNSASSTFVGTSHGLGEVSSAIGGVPFFTTTGGALHFLILLNPLTTARTLTLTLFDANGIQQGAPLVRNLSARDLDALSIPAVFGVATPPTSGSVRLNANGNGFNGWYLQIYPTGSRAVFAPIGLDGDNTTQLPTQGP
jgi:hypothetical protein